MIRRPPRSTRTDTLFPYTTLFRSALVSAGISAAILLAPITVTPWIFFASPDTDPSTLPPLSAAMRSEEHTSELQSLMRISYAVFCLKKKKKHKSQTKIRIQKQPCITTTNNHNHKDSTRQIKT